MTARRRHLPAARAVATVMLVACSMGVHADQRVVSGSGSLTASVQLNFSVSISKYVSLRVGSADASSSDVNFAVGFNPARPSANSQAYAGSMPPTLVVSAPVALSMAAFSNMSNTRLTCSIGPLAGFTALAVGASSGGVPGTNSIAVASGGATTVQHPGANLGACGASNFTNLPMMSALTGTFTYSATFATGSTLAGNYGNVVTYTATTP